MSQCTRAWDGEWDAETTKIGNMILAMESHTIQKKKSLLLSLLFHIQDLLSV